MQMLYPSSDIRENAFTPPSGDVLKCVDFFGGIIDGRSQRQSRRTCERSAITAE
jgi:hypothetical protein